MSAKENIFLQKKKKNDVKNKSQKYLIKPDQVEFVARTQNNPFISIVNDSDIE